MRLAVRAVNISRWITVAALHSILFLLVRTLVPGAEEFALLIFAAGMLFTLLTMWRLSFLAAGVLVTVAVHVLLYERVSGLGFDLHQLIQNPNEAFQSVILTLGNWKAIAAIIEFATSMWGLAWVFSILARRAEIRSNIATGFGVVLIASGIGLGARLGFFYYLTPPSAIEVRFEGNPDDLPTDDQSLFMLQLESVNGPGLYENHLDLPGEAKLKEMGGSIIPYFWGSTFGTNNGFSSILCGTSGALTHHLVRPQDGSPCLPERFKRAGFETVYYYSYKASDFYRMQENVSQMGFQKFIYGEQLMEKSDPFYRWGYEDCQFFDRAFADMKKSGLDRRKKIFVYFSVHMNHTPFENHLPIDHPFKNASSLKEKYLNSAYEQDYCMGKFLEHVKALNRDDINVAISGDHGFPIKHRHELYDFYMTRFQFVPSSKNSKKYPGHVRDDISPAQDQIQSTMLELFGSPRRPASFLWALAGEEKPKDYRSCLLITDRSNNSAYALDGDEVVKKFTVLNTFEKLVYQSRQLKETVPLERISDWQSVRMPPSCFERLGVSKFN